jgi:Mn2+/Fe2+ NRAMP family transporter
MKPTETKRVTWKLPHKQRAAWVRQVLLLLSVVGPGLITANVDNNATGITGYSLAGAQYGYGLLWAVVLDLCIIFRSTKPRMLL